MQKWYDSQTCRDWFIDRETQTTGNIDNTNTNSRLDRERETETYMATELKEDRRQRSKGETQLLLHTTIGKKSGEKRKEKMRAPKQFVYAFFKIRFQ